MKATYTPWAAGQYCTCNASVGVAHNYNYDLCAKSYFLGKCFNIWIIFVKNIISCKTWCNQQSVVSVVYIVWVSWKKWVSFALLILTSTTETIKTIVGENDVSELVVTFCFVVDRVHCLKGPALLYCWQNKALEFFLDQQHWRDPVVFEAGFLHLHHSQIQALTRHFQGAFFPLFFYFIKDLSTVPECQTSTSKILHIFACIYCIL